MPSHSQAVARESVWHEINQTADEIAAMNTRIIHLKRYLNSLAYVSKLPAELLEDIFAQLNLNQICSHTIDGPFYCRECEWELRAALSAMRTVSQICHVWREVAVLSPRLWTNIPTSHGLACMKETIRRSAPLPFRVQVNLSQPPPLQLKSVVALRVAFKRLHRIQELVIHGWQHNFQQTFLKHYIGRGAPFLQTFAIDSDASDHIEDDDFPMILSQPCPSLKILAMRGFSFRSVRSANLPSLQELYLDDVAWQLSTTIGEILSVLEGLPNLKKASLSHDYPDDRGFEAHISDKTVTLPCLQYLRLMDFCTWLLKYLIVPPTVDLHIVVWDYQGGVNPFPSTFEDCVETVCSLLKTHDSLTQSSSVVSDDSTRNNDVAPTEVKFSTDLVNTHFCNIVVRAESCGLCRYHVKIRCGPRTQHALIALALCQSLPLGKAESLSIELKEFPAEGWLSVFTTFPSLQVLRISGRDTILGGLHALPFRSHRHPSQQLPALKKLILNNADHLQPTRDSQQAMKEFVDTLSYSLETRNVLAALRLEELEIDSSLIDGVQLTKLETLVDRLTISSSEPDELIASMQEDADEALEHHSRGHQEDEEMAEDVNVQVPSVGGARSSVPRSEEDHRQGHPRTSSAEARDDAVVLTSDSEPEVEPEPEENNGNPTGRFQGNGRFSRG